MLWGASHAHIAREDCHLPQFHDRTTSTSRVPASQLPAADAHEHGLPSIFFRLAFRKDGYLASILYPEAMTGGILIHDHRLLIYAVLLGVQEPNRAVARSSPSSWATTLNCIRARPGGEKRPGNVQITYVCPIRLYFRASSRSLLTCIHSVSTVAPHRLFIPLILDVAVFSSTFTCTQCLRAFLIDIHGH